MKRRDVIGLQPPTPEKLAWLDAQVIDPLSAEQVALLAQILHTSRGSISDAIAAARPRVREIRKHLAEMPAG